MRVVRHMIIVQLATDTCHMIPTIALLVDPRLIAFIPLSESGNNYRGLMPWSK